jgi:hypothetical protein
MRLHSWLLSGLIGLGLIAGSAASAKDVKDAKDTKKAAEPRKPAAPKLSGQWARMAADLKLSAEQQAQLAEKVKVMDEAVRAFEASKADALKKLKEDESAIVAEKKKLVESKTAEVMAFFTPEQLTAVRVSELAQQAMGRARGVQFTDEQATKVQQLAADADKQLQAIKADDKEAAQKKGEIMKKLEADVTALITPEQKAAMGNANLVREAMKLGKPVKLTAEGEKAIAGAATEAAKKIAALETEREKVLKELRAAIDAEAAKVPAPAPKAGGKAKDAKGNK